MTQKQDSTHYETLGIPASSTQQEIKNAYRKLIFEHHPDRNSSPEAQEMAARLNEAYGILSDTRKRAMYDAWIGSIGSQENQFYDSAPENVAQSEPLPDIRCTKCGCQDTSIRLTLMQYVISVVIMTFKRGAAGIWCSRCRASEARKWSSLSLLLGWWGFPWGIIYTLEAIYANIFGGIQPKHENAILLRIMGFSYHSRGQNGKAVECLEESLKLENDPETRRLLDYIRGDTKASVRRDTRPNKWNVKVVLPFIYFIGLIIIIAFVIFKNQSYKTSQRDDSKQEATTKQEISESSEEAPSKSDCSAHHYLSALVSVGTLSVVQTDKNSVREIDFRNIEFFGYKFTNGEFGSEKNIDNYYTISLIGYTKMMKEQSEQAVVELRYHGGMNQYLEYLFFDISGGRLNLLADISGCWNCEMKAHNNHISVRVPDREDLGITECPIGWSKYRLEWNHSTSKFIVDNATADIKYIELSRKIFEDNPPVPVKTKESSGSVGEIPDSRPLAGETGKIGVRH